MPIYNTPIEKLQRCFKSIESIQTKTYECILVDDGSNSEIGQYASNYAVKSKIFKYIFKENGGVSSARNIGIMNAVGKYICFVDSDDAIEPKAFDSFLSRQSKEDIIFTDLLFVNREKKTNWIVCDTKNITYDKMIKRMLIDGKVNGPVCKFIRKSFLTQHKIVFAEDMIIAEDRAFFLDMLIEKPVMSYMNQISYYYYWEKTSGRERLRKNPMKSLYNYQTIYFKNKLCIDKMHKGTDEKEYLNMCAEEQYIKSIFNTVLGMIEYKINVHEFEHDIEKLLSVANIRNVGTKTKIRKFLLLNKIWRVMKLLAFIRRICLIIKNDLIR